MNNIHKKLIVVFFFAFTLPHLVFTQDNSTNAIDYEVNRVYPPFSITKEKLKEAQSIVDLNPYYKPSWVKEFISVEIVTNHDGKVKKAGSKDDAISQEQKDNMLMADVNDDIAVKILYIPDNTLTHNDVKEYSFNFSIDPVAEAEYTGGQLQLEQYLKENAFDKIPDESYAGYDLSAIKFTVTEEGEIIDAHIFDTSVYNKSNTEKIDKLLLEAISNMPCWKPATYANGIKVKQEFVLTVGNMESCVMNVLSIRNHHPDQE